MKKHFFHLGWEDLTVEMFLPQALYGNYFAMLNLPLIYKKAENWEQAYFWDGLYSRWREPKSSKDNYGADHLTDDQKTSLDKKIAEWEPAPIPDAVKQELADLQARAAAGEAAAQYELGMEYNWPDEYLSGWGLENDVAQAITLWKLAGTQGHAEAQFELGEVYSKGHGAKPDLKEAIRWYRLAAAQGHEDAQRNVDLLEAHGYGDKGKEK